MGPQKALFEPWPGVFGHLLHLHTGRVVAQLTFFILPFPNQRNQKNMFLYLVPEADLFFPFSSAGRLPYSRLDLLLTYLPFFCTFV